MVTTVGENSTALSTRIDGVFAQVNPKLAGDTDSWAGDTTTYVGVWSEQSARIEEDFALGLRVDNLNASFKDSNALIQTELKVRADETSALASKSDILSANIGDNTAIISRNDSSSQC